jgi:hypothetical protein
MALESTQPLNRNEYQEYFLGVKVASASSVPRNFFFLGGGSPNSAEDREKGDLGAVAP